jgi:hypothetical protein
MVNLSQDSSVGIVTRLDDRGIGLRFPAEARDYFLLRNIQTGSGAHTASYATDTGGSIPVGKAIES